jgi:type II secretory pathway pseudopilin PulG
MTARNPESGYTLLLLVATVTVMLITMGVGVPFWRYVVRDDKEQELVFRGGEIADAIAEYQKKNANAAPATLEILVEMKFLRRLYRDPMTSDGQWRLVHQSDVVGPGQRGRIVQRQRGAATPDKTTAGTAAQGRETIGPIVGVASLSKEKGLRTFNGQTTYDQWLFIAGQPRNVSGISRGPGSTLKEGTEGARPGPGGAAPGTKPGQKPRPDVKTPQR